MNRRGFLGSIIGLAAGHSFLAKLITEPYQRIIIPEYRMAFADSISGFTIQAPGIQEIVKDIKGSGFLPGYRFIAEPLNVFQNLTLDKAILLDRNNKIILENRFTSPVYLTSGDILKVQASLNVEGMPLPSLEDTVQHFRNKWEREHLLRS